MNVFKSVFAPITKDSFYRDEDGFLVIPHSIVSDEIVDRDGEIVTAEAMKEAIDEYMQFANIREMHQPIAIGKALKIWQDGKKTLIEAKIIAEEAIKKIEQGVLMGFSIGFKVIEKVGNIYTKIRIIEISAVDVPSNYNAMIGSKSYTPLINLLKEEENMDKENENNVATDVEANKEVDTSTQTDLPAQETVENTEDLQSLEKEALEILTVELEEVKKSFEALKKDYDSLKAESVSKEEEFTSNKEIVKSYKSLSVVHKKYKEENEQLKAEMQTLKADFEALKNVEVNVKTSKPVDVVEKSVDFTQYEVKNAPSEVYNATAILKAKLFKD